MASLVVLVCTAPVVSGSGYTCSRGAQAWEWLGGAGLTGAEFVPVAGAVIGVLLIGAAFRFAIRMFWNR